MVIYRPRCRGGVCLCTMANPLNRQQRQSNPRDRVAPQTCPLAIGPLTLADLESVMELESVSFPSPWTLATYHSELDPQPPQPLSEGVAGGGGRYYACCGRADRAGGIHALRR